MNGSARLLLIFGSLSLAACGERGFDALESPPPLQVTSTSGFVLVLGEPFEAELSAQGGEGAHTWRLAFGVVPPGLALVEDGGARARIVGTPNAAGTYAFRVDVADAFSNVGSFAVTATVSPPGCDPLEIVTTTVAPGFVGHAYLQPIVARGGTRMGYTWSVIAGRLPDGLTLTSSATPATLVHGVPTRTTTVSATIRVTDSDGNQDDRSFVFQIGRAALTVVTSTLPPACPATRPNYAVQLEASGGTGRGYTWSIAGGQLPPGLVLTPRGSIHGTVSGAGYYPFVVEVEDSAGATARRMLAIDVTCALRIVESPLPLGTVNSTYSHQLVATGAQGALTWWTNDPLPLGITLTSTGTLVGVPTQTGTTSFVVDVTDGFSSDSGAFLMQIVAPLSITTSTLTPAVIFIPYSAQLGAAGGQPPYRWSGAGLPPGLTVTSSGRIVGTSTVSGFYVPSFRVRDALHATSTASIALPVAGF